MTLRSLDTAVEQDKLKLQRYNFQKALMNRIRNTHTVWYFDETSTNLWEPIGRLWQPREGFAIQRPKTQGKNLTIMGAISNHGQLYTSIETTTNQETVA